MDLFESRRLQEKKMLTKHFFAEDYRNKVAGNCLGIHNSSSQKSKGKEW